MTGPHEEPHGVDGQEADRDMTGQDPLSSAAEGDDDPGTAALARPGADVDGIHNGVHDRGDDPRPDADGPSFAEAGPPPEAADTAPVTDASPETHMDDPGS